MAREIISCKMFCMIVFVIPSALLNLNIVKVSSSPIYTWPLFSGNPLLEITANISEGNLGCSLMSGNVHDSLGYDGIYVKGIVNSYVELPIDESTTFKGFSFSVFAMAANITEVGTIFHYKQNETAVTEEVDVTDVILWKNQTHLVAETFSVSSDNYSVIATEFNFENISQTWVGFRFCHDHKSSITLATDTGVNVELGTIPHYHLGQPGTLRLGASFSNSWPPFHGSLICLNMYDTGDINLADSLSECSTNNWQQYTVTSQSASSDSCERLKGYFYIKQRNATIEESITTLDNMPAKSRLNCADFCLQSLSCWTFTWDKDLKLCKLYDADYSSYLESSAGCSYYMRRDVCC